MFTLSTYLSNMAPRPTKERKTYHHGDLRRALVQAARELVRESGPEALSLREVARRAGVSQTAPYRHFADRRALVAALAAEGFRDLHMRMVRGAHAASSGKKALRAVAEQYVAFALEHPSEYRLMFGGELARGSALPEFEEASLAVFDLLRGGISTLKEQGQIVQRPTDDIAVTAWATVHGLVMLMLDGQVPGMGKARASQLVQVSTAILMDGIARR
jgi:AcrR family transcriptional regulator